MNRILALSLTLVSISTQAQNSPFIMAVDEYVPAPGQFINTMPAFENGDDAESMARKCTELIANNAGLTVCLGAWGGYITFHFDHPLVNVAGHMDLYIKGNAHVGNAESGIVMVSQDVNDNGLPDDAWYELSGSADIDSSNVVYGYELTYEMLGDSLDVAWKDNLGGEGYVTRNHFHEQEYFPTWLKSPLTFSGTRLPNNAHDTSGNGSYWVLDAYRYGYVDNFPNTDTLGCSFDLDWAVRPLTREAVYLSYVDFVRVYTALNQTCGWIGETSTEISGSIDLHPDAELPSSIESISLPCNVRNTKFDIFGRSLSNNLSGFAVKDGKIILPR